MLKKAASICFLLGALAMGFSISLFFRGVQLLSSGKKATAQVIDFYVDHDQDDEKYLYSPIFEFTTDQGEKIRFHTHGRSSHPTEKLHDKATVIYNPRDPWEAAVLEFAEVFTSTLILSVVGFPLFVFGGAFLAFRWYRQKLISKLSSTYSHDA